MSSQITDQNATQFEIRYARRLHELHARLFGRIHGLLRLAQLTAGLAGAGAFAAGSAGATGVIGLALVIVVAIDYALNPGARSALHKNEKRRYAELMDPDTPTENRLRTLRRLQAEDDGNEIEALRAVAYNDAMKEMGYSAQQYQAYSIKESPSNRLMRCLA